MLVRILVSRNDVQKWGYSIVGASVSIGPHLVRVSLLYVSVSGLSGRYLSNVCVPWELRAWWCAHEYIYIRMYMCTLGTESLVVCT